MPVPHPTWITAFDAAARNGSFTAAAHELGLTPAAISQQVRLLEHHLDAQLFERLPRGVILTDLGQAYAQRLRRGLSEIEDATRSLFANRPAEIVRVRASISCAALVLAPALPDLLRGFPELRVDLSTFVWANRFEDGTSDIDVAFGFGDWPGIESNHLGHEHACVVCHPKSVASLEELAQGKVVQITGSESDWPTLLKQEGIDRPPPASWLTVDSSLIALNTVASGTGATIVLERFAANALALGTLCALDLPPLPVRPSHFLIIRRNSAHRPEVQAVAHWIRGLF